MRDAEAFGLPSDLVATLHANDTDFDVWPTNMPIVQAFLTVQSQWRAVTLGMSGGVYWQGLDYAGVRVGLEEAEIKLTPAQWAGLRLMERSAAAAMNGVRG